MKSTFCPDYVADRFESFPNNKSFYVAVLKLGYDLIYFEIWALNREQDPL